MPVIDVITPAGPGSDHHLADLAASLHSQHVPDGWQVRWLVVCDGPDQAANDLRSRVALDLGADAVWVNHERYWAGASRNRALAHSSAEWIVAVDADDVVCGGAVTAWARAATAHGTWCAFQALDWYPESGETIGFPLGVPVGPMRAGAWLDYFELHSRHISTPTGILWPRGVLVEVGGWAGAPSAEDAGVVLVGTSLQDGWISDKVTFLYRQHPQQDTHGGSERPVAAAADDARAFAVQRARMVVGRRR